MNLDQAGIWNELVVICFKFLYLNFRAETGVNTEKHRTVYSNIFCVISVPPGGR